MARQEKWANRNDVTGDVLINKPASDAYRSNYDLIFRKDKPAEVDLEVNKEAEEGLDNGG